MYVHSPTANRHFLLEALPVYQLQYLTVKTQLTFYEGTVMMTQSKPREMQPKYMPTQENSGYKAVEISKT